MAIISNFPVGGSTPEDIVQIPGGGLIKLSDSFGPGPYTIEFNGEEEDSNFVTKEYIDNLVGDIASALRVINGEVS